MAASPAVSRMGSSLGGWAGCLRIAPTGLSFRNTDVICSGAVSTAEEKNRHQFGGDLLSQFPSSSGRFHEADDNGSRGYDQCKYRYPKSFSRWRGPSGSPSQLRLKDRLYYGCLVLIEEYVEFIFGDKARVLGANSGEGVAQARYSYFLAPPKAPVSRRVSHRSRLAKFSGSPRAGMAAAAADQSNRRAQRAAREAE